MEDAASEQQDERASSCLWAMLCHCQRPCKLPKRQVTNILIEPRAIATKFLAYGSVGGGNSESRENSENS